MRAAAVTALAAAALGMKDGQVIRKLGLQESMWHTMQDQSPSQGYGLLTYALVVDCKRRLEAHHVQMALEALQRQIPILRARVERREDGIYMVASNARVCLTELPPGGDWLHHHHQRANHEQVYSCPNGPHWKMALLQDPSNTTAPPTSSHRAVLYLTIPHTFTDGLSQGLLVGNLLKYLDQALEKGKVERGTSAPVYPCLEDMLPKEKITGSVAWGILQTIGLALRYRKSPFLKAYVAEYDAERSKELPCRMEVASLPPEELTRLRAKCRQHGVTVNAAISAAVSIAGARMLAKTPDGQTNPGPYVLRTMFVVNMRRFLPPEVDRSQLYQSTVGGAASYVKVPSTSTENFWPVASRVHASIMRQINMHMPIVVSQQFFTRIFKPDKWQWQKEVEDNAKRRYAPADYNINNLGSLDMVYPRTTSVVPVEVHRMFRQHGAFEISFGAHMMQTVGGRLFYNLNYVTARVKPEDAARFQKLTMEVLREAATADD